MIVLLLDPPSLVTVHVYSPPSTAVKLLIVRVAVLVTVVAENMLVLLQLYCNCPPPSDEQVNSNCSPCGYIFIPMMVTLLGGTEK